MERYDSIIIGTGQAGPALAQRLSGAGQTVAVIGCGGIGLSVVQGCRIAGAGRIVVVDTVAWKLDLATRLGATDVVNAAAGNPVPPVVEMPSGGVDYAFEAIGTPVTVRQVVRMTRKGGTTVMIGLVPAGGRQTLAGRDAVDDDAHVRAGLAVPGQEQRLHSRMLR